MKDLTEVISESRYLGEINLATVADKVSALENGRRVIPISKDYQTQDSCYEISQSGFRIVYDSYLRQLYIGSSFIREEDGSYTIIQQSPTMILTFPSGTTFKAI